MRTSVPQTIPPKGGGWHLWGVGPDGPYDYVEIEIWREGWQQTHLQEPESNPWMNAVGLWWRPAGPKRSPQERRLRAIMVLRGQY